MSETSSLIAPDQCRTVRHAMRNQLQRIISANELDLEDRKETIATAVKNIDILLRRNCND